MDVFHVIVQKKDGTITRSDKENETSAIKSAKAFVNLRGEPAAIVLHSGNAIFGIPEDILKDTKFLTLANQKVSGISPPPQPSQVIPKKTEKTTQSALPMAEVVSQFDQAMKSGKIKNVPTEVKKPKPCNMMDILESACLAISLSRGIPEPAARELIEQYRIEIEPIAANLTSGTITREEAIQQLVSLLTQIQKSKAPVLSQVPSTALSVEGPNKLVNIPKIMRGRKGMHFDATRVRFDIAEDEDVQSASPTSLPAGIIIHFTKDVDPRVHEIVATAHGYTSSTWINSHDPSTQPGYDYQKILSLGRPTYKNPIWTASGGRVAHPADLVNKLQSEFPEEKVLVIVAAGVELI